MVQYFYWHYNNKYIAMLTNRQPKPRANSLFPKNAQVRKQKLIKLTPIKQLKQKIHLLLPEECKREPQTLYTPQKLSSAITARLKSTSQNSNRFRTSFMIPKSFQHVRKISPVCVNSQSLLSKLDRTNQRKISNLLHVQKRKSHSTNSIAVAYENLLPLRNQFNYPSQAARQVLRLTKIREMFCNMEPRNKKSRIVEKFSNLAVIPKRVDLKKGQRYTRSVSKTEPDQSVTNETEQSRPQRIFKAELHRRLKVKPSQVITVRIENLRNSKMLAQGLDGLSSERKLAHHREELEINRWEEIGQDKEEEDQYFCEMYDSHKGSQMKPKPQKKPSQPPEQKTSQADNAFFVTRTNTYMQ